MIKMFVTDLDGTFLAVHHKITQKCIDTVSSIHEDKKLFVVATGRNPGMAKIKEFNCITICANGALILNEKNEVIYMDLIDKKLLKELNELGYDYEYVCADWVYRSESYTHYQKHFVIPAGRDDKWAKQYMEDSLKTEKFSIPFEEILMKDVFKVNIHKRTGVDYSLLEEYLKKAPLVNASAGENLIEITNDYTNKASAIFKLCEIYHLLPEEVAVFGDADNDLIMLSSFENSYTVADGTESAKQTAHTVLASHDTYSVCNQMLFLLSQK